tara:strand:+ start:9854 stop:10834 length:981 start_codon:yes stop_codon:yes gene_type:complete
LKKNTVLVTGAAGFIGSFLCESLIDKNYYVIGVDNFFRGKRNNLSRIIKNKNFKLIKCDLTKTIEIKELLKKIKKNNINYIYHYGAINGTEHFYDKSFLTFNNNIKMTENLFKYIVKKNIKSLKKIAFASSSEIYGSSPKVFPTNENCDYSIILNSNRDSYASSKVFGEFYIKLFCEKFKIPYLIFRIFNTYGPRMVDTKYGQVIPEFIKKCKSDKLFTIIGKGDQTRSFCYIDDHVRLANKLVLNNKIKNNIVNLGNEEEITILYLAKLIHKISNKKFVFKNLKSRIDDPVKRCPDITFLKKLTNDKPFISIKEGLKKLIENEKY